MQWAGQIGAEEARGQAFYHSSSSSDRLSQKEMCEGPYTPAGALTMPQVQLATPASLPAACCMKQMLACCLVDIDHSRTCQCMKKDRLRPLKLCYWCCTWLMLPPISRAKGGQSNCFADHPHTHNHQPSLVHALPDSPLCQVITVVHKGAQHVYNFMADWDWP